MKVESSPILTVAVPAYNVGRYLEQNIESLINHDSLHKIEILIIDDGSTDNTFEIARKFQNHTKSMGNSPIKVLRKQNGGHGSSINLGIESASGKYFKLLDGDDFFETDNFVKLIKILENEDSDIILTDYMEYYDASRTRRPVKPYASMRAGEQYVLDKFDFKKGPLLSTTTCRTELLKRSKFKIDENCFYVDMEYNFIVYIMSRTVTYYPLDIYNYRLGDDGQSMSKQSLAKNYLQHERVCLRLASEYERRENSLGESKNHYLLKKLIVPLCATQYMILTEYLRSRREFCAFDNKLAGYLDLYHDPEIEGLIIRLHRRTRGITVPVNNVLRRTARAINYLKNRQVKT